MKRLRIGKYSWGHLRIGSYLSMGAILIAFGTKKWSESMGSPDTLWVDITSGIALLILIIEMGCRLMRLTPRKRWERVMNFGLASGAGVLISSLILRYMDKGEGIVGWFMMAGGLLVVVVGGGGYLMWHRSLRRLNSQLLDREMKKKSHRHE